MSEVPAQATIVPAPAYIPRSVAQPGAAAGGGSFLGNLAAVLGREDDAGATVSAVGVAPQPVALTTLGQAPADPSVLSELHPQMRATLPETAERPGLPDAEGTKDRVGIDPPSFVQAFVQMPVLPETISGGLPPAAEVTGTNPRGGGVGRAGRGGANTSAGAADDEISPNGAEAIPRANDGLPDLAALVAWLPVPQPPRPHATGAGDLTTVPISGPERPPPSAPLAAVPDPARSSPAPELQERSAQSLSDTTDAVALLDKLAGDPPAVAALTPDAFGAANARSISGSASGARAAEVWAAAPAASSPSSVYPQIAPALVSLAGGPPGTQRLTLRLDPVELGLVQIRIDRVRGAPAEVSIIAERPETLALLKRDQHQLHLALDQAGIQADGRQVQFYSAASLADDAGQSPASPFTGSGLDTGGSGRGQAGRDGTPGRPGQKDAGVASDNLSAPIRFGWLRAGIDITA